MTDEPTIKERLFKYAHPKLWIRWVKPPFSFLRLHDYTKRENYSLSEITRTLEKKRS